MPPAALYVRLMGQVMANDKHIELLAALREEYQQLHPAGRLIVRAKLRGMERRAKVIELDSNNDGQAVAANCT